MMTDRNSLLTSLNLTPTLEQASQLEALRRWCQDHCSQDIQYEGSAAEQYAAYLRLATRYLEDFLAHVPASPEQKVPGFGDLTALQFAARQGYQRFIEAQQNLTSALINEQDADGMSPLHHSAAKGFVHTVNALLDKGANPHQLNAQQQFPVRSALFVPLRHDEGYLQRKEQIFNTLLPLAPEALTQHSSDGSTLLHSLSVSPLDFLVVDLLKKNPELAFLQDNASRYPIHSAILNHRQKAIDSLLAIKGVADLTDSQKRTPLHYAARYGSADIVESACRATSNVNCRDSEQKTPLIWAAIAQNKAAMTVLQDHGADPDLIDYQGLSVSCL